MLVLGIDAANPALLLEWARDGSLPTIGSLIQRGLVGETQSIEGLYVGSTWPSFYTGVNPAQHGLHYLVQLEPGTYDYYRRSEMGLVSCDPFWSWFSRAGRRVAILDVPLTSIDRSLHGLQTVEWGGHDAVYGFETAPSDAAQEIQSRFGDHPIGTSCDAIRRTASDYRDFIHALIRGVHAKGELTRHFLRQGGWDFFMQVFTESHCVGHQCWHLHDERHPAHDAAIAAEAGNPLRQVYSAIDTALGEILADADDAIIFVVVPHGMSYWFGAQFLLSEILEQLGVAHRPVVNTPERNLTNAVVDTLRRGWSHVPPAIRERVWTLRERIQSLRGSEAPLPPIGVDPATSRCFVHPNGLAVGGIRLNLRGREPHGILPPEDADTFCEELTAALTSIVDERTERPLIRGVRRTRELFSGDRLADLPDLLVEWSDEIPTGTTQLAEGAGAWVRARSPRFGCIEGVNDYGRTGEHRPGGLFIAAGPTVRSGRLQSPISILDFAPTFARLLGVDLPKHDGQPIELSS